MPESYRPPLRKDKLRDRTYSQSKSTNLSADSANVGTLLERKGADVVSIGPNETLGRAVEILRDRGIGALLVTGQDSELIGILSERDIVRKLAETPGKTLPQRVSDVMTQKVETCTEEEPLIDVLRRMTVGRFRHMPAVRGASLIGMVTIGDVVNYRLRELEHEALQLKQLIVG
ncbi:MAG: CBS domain-containing protein [Pseudomonadota bacterium]